MKLLMIFISILFIQCTNNTNQEDKVKLNSINLVVNKDIFNADGKDYVELLSEGFYSNGEKINITDKAIFYNNDVQIKNNFTTFLEEDYLVYAEYRGIKSNELKINSKHTKEFIYKGVDLSFLPEAEDNGIMYKNILGEPKDIFEISKKNGINTVRLRLWVDNKYCNIEDTLILAKKIKKNNMNFLLDFHYSDTWADPANQIKPKSWDKLDFDSLNNKVYSYTLEVLNKLKDQNTIPQLVQIGNEINNGLLNPAGSKMKDLSTLLKSGIKAVRDINEDIKVIIHIAGTSEVEYFFDELLKNNVEFDIIGLSYYPWWHGKDLLNLKKSLDSISGKYKKELMIVETAYPWTLEWNDWTNNIIGSEEQLIENYLPTIEGQKNFLEKMIDIVKNNNNGIGLIYWGAEYVSFKGNESLEGSTWENLALFDFENKELTSMEAFLEK